MKKILILMSLLLSANVASAAEEIQYQNILDAKCQISSSKGFEEKSKRIDLVPLKKPGFPFVFVAPKGAEITAYAEIKPPMVMQFDDNTKYVMSGSALLSFKLEKAGATTDLYSNANRVSSEVALIGGPQTRQSQLSAQIDGTSYILSCSVLLSPLPK